MVITCKECDEEFEPNDWQLGWNVFDCPHCKYSDERYIEKADLWSD